MGESDNRVPRLTRRESNGGQLRLWDLDDVLDVKAFVVVMNIIHGRNRNVPRAVDLEMLSKIAVVVHYLGCHEAVEVFSSIWIDHLKPSIPDTYCRDLVLWILITSVFRDAELFKSVTHTAILKSDQKIPTLGLPIQAGIICKSSPIMRRHSLDTNILGNSPDRETATGPA